MPAETPEDAPGEVTRLLRAWHQGEAAALERLLPLVYDELRRLAARRMRGERRDHTLQPTDLVHESFLRLVGRRAGFADRAHFFAVAAREMRRVAVDHARARAAQKRGSAPLTLELKEAQTPAVEPASVDVMALDEALTRLEEMDAQQARIVELRYFAGLSLEETAEVLDVSRPTVVRDWRSARVWLFRQLSA